MRSCGKTRCRIDGSGMARNQRRARLPVKPEGWTTPFLTWPSSCEHGETQKITSEGTGAAGLRVLVEKEPTELLPRAEDLAAPVTPPAVVTSGQVKQLQGPRQSSLEPVGASSCHEGGDDLTNELPQCSILDVPGTIALRRTDVDHRIEFEPRLPLLGGIQVDAPQVRLRGPVLDQGRILVRVQLAADGHQASSNVDDDCASASDARRARLVPLRRISTVT